MQLIEALEKLNFKDLKKLRTKIKRKFSWLQDEVFCNGIGLPKSRLKALELGVDDKAPMGEKAKAEFKKKYIAEIARANGFKLPDGQAFDLLKLLRKVFKDKFPKEEKKKFVLTPAMPQALTPNQTLPVTGLTYAENKNKAVPVSDAATKTAEQTKKRKVKKTIVHQNIDGYRLIIPNIPGVAVSVSRNDTEIKVILSGSGISKVKVEAF